MIVAISLPMLSSLWLTLSPTALLASSGAREEPRRSWTIQAEELHTGAGRTIANGTVTVGNGKIAAVGAGSDDVMPNTVLKAFAVTPGMIDASVRIHDRSSVEQSREVTADLRASDAVDPYAIEWDRQLRSGVTTVLANAPDFNVVGGLGVVLKTGGDPTVASRTLKQDAVLRGAMGSQPSQSNHPASGRPTDFFSRRPTTRMGVEWEWRKAFYDAASSRKDPARAFPGSASLVSVLDGKLPLAIQAWTTQDIRTAVFLKEEIEREGLGKPQMFLDAAAEAWKEPQLLVRSHVAIVLPPFPVAGRTGEGSFMAWNVAKELHDQGVLFALSSHGAPGLESRLALQAGYAMNGGLPFDAALAAVTINPARLLGVEERVGSIEVGKDADLVLWSGPPFEPASRVIAVLLDGELKFDGRTSE
jgi:imidazolonepropionase-like amidohydrolase